GRDRRLRIHPDRLVRAGAHACRAAPAIAAEEAPRAVEAVRARGAEVPRQAPRRPLPEWRRAPGRPAGRAGQTPGERRDRPGTDRYAAAERPHPPAAGCVGAVDDGGGLGGGTGGADRAGGQADAVNKRRIAPTRRATRPRCGARRGAACCAPTNAASTAARRTGSNSCGNDRSARRTAKPGPSPLADNSTTPGCARSITSIRGFRESPVPGPRAP